MVEGTATEPAFHIRTTTVPISNSSDLIGLRADLRQRGVLQLVRLLGVAEILQLIEHRVVRICYVRADISDLQFCDELVEPLPFRR